MAPTVASIAGKEHFEEALTYELRQASGGLSNPGIIFYALKTKDPTLAERVAQELLNISLANTNFGSGDGKQFIDYVANYDGRPAVILSRGDGFVSEVSKRIQDELSRKMAPTDVIEVETVHVAAYEGANDTVEAMLARALKR